MRLRFSIISGSTGRIYAGSVWGAYTALRLAALAPGRCQSAIVLAAGSGSHPPTREAFLANCFEMADLMEREGAVPAAAMGKGPTRIQLFNKNRDIWDLSVEHDARAAAHTLRSVQAGRPSLVDQAETLAAITAPVLLMAGDEDEATLDVNLFLKRIMPSARWSVLPGSGHAITLEEPGRVNQLVDQFITAVEDGSWRPRNGRRGQPGPRP